MLDTDSGREKFWAVRSVSGVSGFRLEFASGATTSVHVRERVAPELLRLSYFGSETTLTLDPCAGGGTLLEVRCECEDPAEWFEFYAGWVGWLLILKGACDHGIDLRNASPERTWDQGFVDQ